MSSVVKADPGDAPEPEHFWRPSTRFNRVVESALRVLPMRPIERAEVERLQRRSVETFLELGGSAEALRRAVAECEWKISDGRAPADAWGGEVLCKADGTPLVVLYDDSPLTRLPSPIFRLAAQLAVDHMLGHLHEYYAGAADWGEEIATRWQFRLLRRRGGALNGLLALAMVLGSRFHKQIPLSSYRRGRA